jgi:hypothetical protein
MDAMENLAARVQQAELSRGGHHHDARFRALVGKVGWSKLPPAVRRRFETRLADGLTAVYIGEVTEVRASLAGRWLARLAVLIGGPLPLVWDAPTPCVVTVTESGDGGQIWTRLYARRFGFPQIVHSSKQFAGPTGLEEHVGRGVGMALEVGVEDSALVFKSAFYFVAIGERRLRLPKWMEPGRITVRHIELGDRRFAFTLDVVHNVLGELLHQRAIFREDLA